MTIRENSEMKSNLPIELTMAVACVAVFFAVPPTTDPDGTVVSPLGSPLIAIVNYRRVLEKEKREAAFKSSSVESAAEIQTGAPQNRKVRTGAAPEQNGGPEKNRSRQYPRTVCAKARDPGRCC